MSESPGPRYLHGFNGLRAIAILLVILWHTLLQTEFPIALLGPMERLVLSGWAGVDLFFAVSGFLITWLILEEEAASPGGRFSLGRFYMRRALRILPPFYLVFVVNFLVFAKFAAFQSVILPRVIPPESPIAALAYGTFWSNYYEAYVGMNAPAGQAFSVYWSLCVEEHFYLTWPFVLVALRNRRLRILVAVTTCLLLSVWRYAAHTDPQSTLAPTHIHTLSHFRFDSILWGAVGALLLRELSAEAVVRRVAMAGATVIVGLLVYTRDLSIVPGGTALGHSVGLTALSIGSVLLLIELSANERSALTRVLEFKPLAAIGKVSYGMYLLHSQAIDITAFVMLGVLKWRFPSWWFFLLLAAVASAITFAAAFAMYRLVEKPILRAKDKYFGRKPPRTGLSTERGGAYAPPPDSTTCKSR